MHTTQLYLSGLALLAGTATAAGIAPTYKQITLCKKVDYNEPCLIPELSGDKCCKSLGNAAKAH